MVKALDAVGEEQLRLPHLAVVAGGAQGALLQPHAGEHRHLGPHGAQALEDFRNLPLGVGAGIVGAAQQVAGLGHVGHHDVRPAAQAGHAIGHLGGVGLVELAAVAHDRVHQNEGVLPAEPIEHLLHQADLRLAAQKARVQRLEPAAHAFPVACHGEDIAGEVPVGKAGKAAGVGGEHRRGQHAGLHAAAGEHRQGHREGALAHAGDVVDGQAGHFFIVHGNHLFRKDFNGKLLEQV